MELVSLEDLLSNTLATKDRRKQPVDSFIILYCDRTVRVTYVTAITKESKE